MHKAFPKTILLIIVYLSFFPSRSLAQVIPDQTLGSESSTIRSIDNIRDVIEGGTIRGENLFHSFRELNIGEGASLSFSNPEGISNIFSRVTGSNISQILGTLGVNGAANLFLMNPNGIVFGENAAIDIGGSFLATTAENIQFDDGTEFSSIEPNKPLLTIDFPIGLGFGSQSGTISIKDAGHAVVLEDAGLLPIKRKSNAPGLQVVSGKNMALIGSQINLDGGILISEGGSIELAGIKEGTIGLKTSPNNSAWDFEYSGVTTFGNINLENTSLVDASVTPISIPSPNANKGISIVGQNILIKDESLVLIQNQINTSEGKIEVNAANSFTISKVEIDPIPEVPGGLISETLGFMPGANIFVTSPKISLVDGGTILSKTFGPAKGGDISIEASKSIFLSRSSIDDIPPIPSNISNFAYFDGKTGVTIINTPSLTIEDGARITNIAVVGGDGDDIIINANKVILEGLESEVGIVSSNISSIASGESQAANIFLNTSTLEIDKGAAIVSNSFNLAKPGRINVSASNSVQIRGLNSQISSAVSNPSDALLEDLNLLELNDAPIAIGDSQDVNIRTDTLQIMDYAFVSVLNFGIGNGGNMNIEANLVELQNQGGIIATATSGQGGNIVLNSDNLELFDQSQITANAGGTGNGGNITIDSNTILGIENSDITANAVGGDGGNVTINSDFIVGLESRPELTPFSDITATSEFGIDGTVSINSPETDADDEIAVASFQEETSTIEIVKNSCSGGSLNQGSRLVINNVTLQETPYSFIDYSDRYSVAIEQIRQQENSVDANVSPYSFSPFIWQPGDPVIEPDFVTNNPDGTQTLVASNEFEVLSSSQSCQKNVQ